MSEWTLEQAAELVCEQLLDLLDGCDDDDTVRPQLVFEAVAKAWVPSQEFEQVELTACEFRKRLHAARARLAAGWTIP